MSRPEDPYGKRALFSPAPNGAPAGGDQPVGSGRRALFSSTRPLAHSEGRHARLECSSCRESRDVAPVSLARRMVPSLWVPGLRWPVYMRCPVCTDMTWCAIDLRPLLRR